MKPIKFEELSLSVADMEKLAEGARLYMQPELDLTDTVTEQPMVTKRQLNEG